MSKLLPERSQGPGPVDAAAGAQAVEHKIDASEIFRNPTSWDSAGIPGLGHYKWIEMGQLTSMNYINIFIYYMCTYIYIYNCIYTHTCTHIVFVDSPVNPSELSQ